VWIPPTFVLLDPPNRSNLGAWQGSRSWMVNSNELTLK
jgi:hypothetical protein